MHLIRLTTSKNHVHQTLNKALADHNAEAEMDSEMGKVSICGKQVEMQVGMVHVLRDKVKDALRRSGTNGTMIFYLGFDTTTELIRPAKKRWNWRKRQRMLKG